MKKILLFSMLITVALVFSNCSKDDDNDTKDPDTENGNYNATGTISLKAGDVSYSIPITGVYIGTYSLTINSLNADLANYGNAIVSIVSTTGSIVTGTYSATNGTSFTFLGNDLCAYQAASIRTNSSCTIKITTLTSTSIQGTFTALVNLYSGSCASTVSIIDGVINCTITSKLED